MILYTLQGANWQRSGGQGDTPTRIERPRDRRAKTPTTAEQLAARRRRFRRR